MIWKELIIAILFDLAGIVAAFIHALFVWTFREIVIGIFAGKSSVKKLFDGFLLSPRGFLQLTH